MNRQDLNKVLNRFTASNVKLRGDRKREALDCWQPIVNNIVDFVKRGDARFASLNIFPTGSYYDRSKVGEPDEFDLMLVMENLELDDKPYEAEEEDDGMSDPPTGFTRVMIDRGEEVLWQRESCVNRRGMLNAIKVKAVFARLVRDAIENLGYKTFVGVTSHGPAVTLQITNRSNWQVYSVDLVLAIRDKTWPEYAEEWRNRHRGWPNPRLVQEICQDGCYLVAKQPKGGNVPDHEKGFLWLFSFSAAEKKLALHGGHGEASSCRKQVLRILKALKEELNLHPLKSYHLKTILLYECEAYPDPSNWSFDCLGERFIGLLQKLEYCLSQSKCPHYFIKNFNLFEMFPQQRCDELVGNIQRIRRNPEQVVNRLVK